MDDAVGRRLEQELGMSAVLSYVYKFQYQASFGERGSENELCSVYIGRSEGEPRVNSTEIEACRWMQPTALTDALTNQPEDFTPWFRMEWEALQDAHSEALADLMKAA